MAVDGVDAEQKRDAEPCLVPCGLLEPVHRLDDVVDACVQRPRPPEGGDGADAVLRDFGLDVFEVFRPFELARPGAHELADFLRERHPAEQVVDSLVGRNGRVPVRSLFVYVRHTPKLEYIIFKTL